MYVCRFFRAVMSAVLVFAASLWAQGATLNGVAYGDLSLAIAAINAPGDYVIVINADQNITAQTIISGANVTLFASGARSVRLLETGALFTVSEGATFTLANGVTLIGRNDVSAYQSAPVVLTHGTFNMDGGTITGNTSGSTDGAARAGGVGIADGATFNMRGGMIFGNAYSGSGGFGVGAGGVLVGKGSTFNMYGGEITGNINSYISTSNSSSSNGAGGVYVTDGTFNMFGGTISGNSQTGQFNFAAAGGVYLANVSTFNMFGGTITNNSATSSPSGDGVYVNATSLAYFSGTPVIDDGVFVRAELDARLRIGGSGLQDGAMIVIQGSISGDMDADERVTGTYNGLTDEMAKAFVSRDKTLVGVKEGNRVVWADNYNLSINQTAPHNFGTAIYGYDVQASHSATVTNTGLGKTNLLSITLTGANAGAFELLQTSIANIEPGASESFAVRPKTKLNAGTYEATVVVSGNYGISVSYDVRFTVTPAALTVVANSEITIYGEAAPPFTASFLPSFKNDDDESVLDGELIFTCAYKPGDNVNLDAGYAIVPSGLTSNNYNITFVSGTLNVDYRIATITVTPNDKVYDGNTSATFSSAVINNKFPSDSITIHTGTATFASPNAGDGRVVSFAGFSISGAKASNYILFRQPLPATANITPKEINISGADIFYGGKVYDGTRNVDNLQMVDLSSHADVIAGDAIAASVDSAKFDNQNAGSRRVTIYGLTLRGPQSGNYTLSQSTVVKENVEITKRPLVLKVDDKVIMVGGDVNSVFPFDYTLTTLVAGDSKSNFLSAGETINIEVEEAYFTNNNLNAGVFNAVAQSASSDNYEILYLPGIITVTGKIAINREDIVIDSGSFEYNGTRQSPIFTYEGLDYDCSDVGFSCRFMGLTVNNIQYDSAAAGPANAAPTQVGNYIVEVRFEDDTYIGKTSVAFAITPKQLTISSATHTKVYDGARNAGTPVTVTLLGRMGLDNVMPGVVTASYPDASAGTTSLVITNVTLTGAQSHNYMVTVPATLSVDGITRRPITQDMFSVSPQLRTGSPVTPVPVAYGDVTFDIRGYSNNINAGTATVNVGGTGNYTGTLSLPFTIFNPAAPGTGTLSIAGWVYGEPPNSPVVSSSTNDIHDVVFEYKLRNASDAAYTTRVPVNAGDYVVRATFATNMNYWSFERTANFTIAKAPQDKPDIPGLRENSFGTPVDVSFLPTDMSRIPIDISGVPFTISERSVSLLFDDEIPNMDKWEYCISGGTQYQGPDFINLKPNTEYAIFVRVMESENYLPSAASAILLRTFAADAMQNVDDEIADNMASAADNYGISLGRNVVSDMAEFFVNTQNGSTASVVIYDRMGSAVFRRTNVASGEKITWNLTTASGSGAADGSYLIVAVSRDASGKVHRHTKMLGVRR